MPIVLSSEALNPFDFKSSTGYKLYFAVLLSFSIWIWRGSWSLL